MIKLLAIGDVMGRPGRQALVKGLDRAREELNPDFVVMNGENVAGGFGITKKIFEELIGPVGIDCITTGNHWMDKKDIYEFRDHPKIVLPANMSNVDEPTRGLRLLETKGGVRVAVMNLIGKVFMKGDNSSPFAKSASLIFMPRQPAKNRLWGNFWRDGFQLFMAPTATFQLRMREFLKNTQGLSLI